MSRSVNPASYAAQAAGTLLFRGIAEEGVHLLLNKTGVRVEHFEKDAVLFDRLSRERALGVVLRGSCAVTKDGEDGGMPMSVLKEGDLFGAASLFQDANRYVARVTAESSVWVLLIAEDALKSMMREDFRVAENYLAYLTARIRFLSDRLDGFLPQSVEERVLRYMQQHAQNGLYEPEWSVSALAEALRVSRTTLYRALDKLTAEGKIVRAGKAFRLTGCLPA